MSSRSHLWLRGGALALLVAAGIWPRGAGVRHDAITTADAMRGAGDAAMTAGAPRATRGLATRTPAEASHRRFTTPAPSTELATAAAADMRLNN